MTGIGFIGLNILIVFVILQIALRFVEGRIPLKLRRMQAFERLRNAIERSVEAGERVHFSLGTGSLTGAESAPALAGLALLGQVASATTMSDKPVVVSAGDGAMTILAQDTLRCAYQQAGRPRQYEATSGRVLGLTPFSYVAGLPPVLESEDVSAHVLLGSFGPEGALAAHFGNRQQAFVLGGTDDVPSQALLYATTDYPLIGEEAFTAGAYLDIGPSHIASVRTQDLLRVVIIVGILVGTVVVTIGSFL